MLRPDLHGLLWLRGCSSHEAALVGGAQRANQPLLTNALRRPLSPQGWCALILIAFTVFFRLMALLALKRLNFQQR